MTIISNKHFFSYIKKIKLFIPAILAVLLPLGYVLASSNLATKLSGRILLQVESVGEAWYVNPLDHKRYSMGSPKEAFELMRSLGTGISDSDLKKIPVGYFDYSDGDDDGDGLSNNFEDTIGTDKNKNDSDEDGYDDSEEIKKGYNPHGSGKISIDENFVEKKIGLIFLQVEKNGEAWYLDPVTKKRFYMARPKTAFAIMRNFGLGITNDDLNQIPVAYSELPPVIIPIKPSQSNDTMNSVMQSLLDRNLEEFKKYFTENMQVAAEYTFNFLDDDGKLTLANILSSAKLTNSTSNKKIYSKTIFFNNEKHDIIFNLEKQEDGKWVLMNL